ncbi:uncharacterized protein LOC123508526 [Portunus trituberculatus]|uniref:uncharacterized protein LOC123508526 n=1 Tax=Portunus trituberculatus TaxID=210409 RepID=UPI001E1CD908|nr:uncharacterized protein LOC123508526 [Portunus trituberculatus]
MWSPLPGDGGTGQPSTPVVPASLAPPPGCELQAASSSSSKRTMDDANTSGDDLTPASKFSRPDTRTCAQAGDVSLAACDRLPTQPSCLPPVAPPFAPRSEYMKLEFPNNPGVDVKLRWLSEVTRHFSLDRALAEVKMSAVTSRFVYVSRRRQDIVQSVVAGDFLALKLRVEDSPERPRKFPSYLFTRYPVGVDSSFSRELPGVYSARRFRQNGQPLNRIVVTWSHEEPPRRLWRSVFCRVCHHVRFDQWLQTVQCVFVAGR